MRAYKVVDAFSSKPFLGNPVAVVFDAEGLATAEMQAIARWTNLSETTFLLPPTSSEADYRLRIFTPRSELPFAGHPTLGSAHAVLEAGRVMLRAGRLVQECGVGLVRIAVEGDGAERRLTLALPPAKVTALSAADVDELEAVIGHRIVREVAPAIVDVGAVWVVAQLADADSVLALTPDFRRSATFEKRLGVTGLSLFGRHADGEAAIEVRSLHRHAASRRTRYAAVETAPSPCSIATAVSSRPGRATRRRRGAASGAMAASPWRSKRTARSALAALALRAWMAGLPIKPQVDGRSCRASAAVCMSRR